VRGILFTLKDTVWFRIRRNRCYDTVLVGDWIEFDFLRLGIRFVHLRINPNLGMEQEIRVIARNWAQVAREASIDSAVSQLAQSLIKAVYRARRPE
jgi:hypothetical protein